MPAHHASKERSAVRGFPCMSECAHSGGQADGVNDMAASDADIGVPARRQPSTSMSFRRPPQNTKFSGLMSMCTKSFACNA